MAFAVIKAHTLAAMQQVKAAGCSHVVVFAYWDALQTSPGAALSTSALSAFNTILDNARTVGLAVILEQALHYPPDFVLNNIEKYIDQAGNEGQTAQDTGGNIRNWMWTALGRQYVADYWTKLYAGISPANRTSIVGVRLGGGFAGEVQYCRDAIATPYSYWAYGPAMLSGTGLAAGLTANPNPTYTPYTGDIAKDIAFVNWYLGGIEDWIKWQLLTLKNIGWRCKLYVLHPSFSVRRNHTLDQAKGEVAKGVDYTRAIGLYKNNPQAWPWSTWINGTDPWPSDLAVDSNGAAWRKLYAEARVRGKHHDMWGENTGGESAAGMQRVFNEPLNPQAGAISYSGTPRGDDTRYKNLAWLEHASLVSGNGAQFADYTGLIEDYTD